MNNKAFYTVWNPSKKASHVVHLTIEDARKEASRLAALNPDEYFYVMRTVQVAHAEQPVKISWMQNA